MKETFKTFIHDFNLVQKKYKERIIFSFMKSVLVISAFLIAFFGITSFGAASLTSFATNPSINSLIQTHFPSCTLLKSGQRLFLGYQIPKEIPFTTENINIYLNNTFYSNLILKNKSITDFYCTPSKNNTYDIYIENSTTVLNLISSNNTLKTAQRMIKNNQIKIKGITFSKKIKTFFLKIGLSIYSWFK